MRVEGKAGAGAVVEPRDDIRAALRERPDLCDEAEAVELGSEQRRGFGLAARRILGVDGDETFEQADEATDIGLRAHSTFPRAATS